MVRPKLNPLDFCVPQLLFYQLFTRGREYDGVLIAFAWAADAVVPDYHTAIVDGVPMLARMYKKRLAGFCLSA